MKKYQKETQLIISLDGRIAGWTSVTNHENGTFHGDKELTKEAKIAALIGTKVTLFNSVCMESNAHTITGAYAAFASIGLERLKVEIAPDGFLEGLGLVVREINEETAVEEMIKDRLASHAERIDLSDFHKFH